MIGVEYICQHQDSFWILGFGFIVNELIEYWLGKTDKVSSGSKLELVLTALRGINKEDKMEVGKLKVDLVGGKAVLQYDAGPEGAPAMIELSLPLGALMIPLVMDLEAKVVSGEIDLIPDTDFDKELMLKGLAELKKALA